MPRPRFGERSYGWGSTFAGRVAGDGAKCSTAQSSPGSVLAHHTTQLESRVPAVINLKAAARMGRWQWAVSLLLLSATMINYMDRQTLANLSVRIKDQFELSNQQYGNLEQAFSISFAVGSLLWGVLADVIPVRYLYPFVLVGWSLIGFATGLSNGYESLYLCRAALGFFESGHWPCALVVTHSILTSSQRPLANSVLQSGASIGAIITPIVILMMVPAVAPGDTMQPDAWRPPFLVVGAVGCFGSLPGLQLSNAIRSIKSRGRSKAIDRPTSLCFWLILRSIESFGRWCSWSSRSISPGR